MSFRKYTSTITATDTEFVIETVFGANVNQTVITRGGSDETNFKAAMWADLQLVLANYPSSSTSLPCSVLTRGKLSKLFAGDTFTTQATTIQVPPGNPGDVQLRIDPGGYSLTYTKNADSPVAVVDTDIITFVDGDTFKLTISTIGEQEIYSGYLVDVETGQQIDSFQLMNTTPIV